MLAFIVPEPVDDSCRTVSLFCRVQVPVVTISGSEGLHLVAPSVSVNVPLMVNDMISSRSQDDIEDVMSVHGSVVLYRCSILICFHVLSVSNWVLVLGCSASFLLQDARIDNASSARRYFFITKGVEVVGFCLPHKYDQAVCLSEIEFCSWPTPVCSFRLNLTCNTL